MLHSPLLLKYPGIRSGMSTRQGGVSPEPLGMNLSFRVGDVEANVSENRRRFFEMLGCSGKKVAIPGQCHSDRVQIVTKPGNYDSTDGLLTTALNLTTVVTIADCLAVILYDPIHRVTGAVHAGWKGTARSIVAKTVDLMKREFGSDAADLIAYLSPSARVCCYEVGAEVAKMFPVNVVEQRGSRMFLDLMKANADQLGASGLKHDHIDRSDWCTICNPALFHSYRRDGEKSGRMMAAACLVPEGGR
nr:multi-copper polyphenol oxidoreductase [uncultured bacterium]